MKKIYIFKGSKKGFDNHIKNIQGEFEIFTRLIHKNEKERKRLDMFVHGFPKNENDQNIDETKSIPEIDNLVIYSNHYTFVIEEALFNIKFFLDLYNVGNLYIQNPPHFLEEILKIEYTEVIEYLPEEIYPTLNQETLIILKQKTQESIIGQEYALKRFLTNLQFYTATKNRKPLILLFYGSTGIGKTQTAQYLSIALGKDLFRKQMSMGYGNEAYTYFYGGKHSEKSFAKDLLERESNIILLDEFDKIGMEFHNAFYQFFDEGLYQDHNYSVELKNSVIICTSNYLSIKDIKENLGDAIFSRFNDVIEFKNLNIESLDLIIDKTIDEEVSNLSNEYSEVLNFKEIKQKYYGNNQTILTLKNARAIKNHVRYVLGYEIGEINQASSTSPTYKEIS